MWGAARGRFCDEHERLRLVLVARRGVLAVPAQGIGGLGPDGVRSDLVGQPPGPTLPPLSHDLDPAQEPDVGLIRSSPATVRGRTSTGGVNSPPASSDWEPIATRLVRRDGAPGGASVSPPTVPPRTGSASFPLRIR